MIPNLLEPKGTHVACKREPPTHLPPPHPPGERPQPKCPPLAVVKPPPGTEQLPETYILERAVREISVPFILNLCDLAGGLVVANDNLAADGLFLADALDDIAGLQVHVDGVTTIGDLMVQTLNLGECCLEAVLGMMLVTDSECGKASAYPLRLGLLAACCYCKGVFECGVILPQL